MNRSNTLFCNDLSSLLENTNHKKCNFRLASRDKLYNKGKKYIYFKINDASSDDQIFLKALYSIKLGCKTDRYWNEGLKFDIIAALGGGKDFVCVYRSF